MATERVNIIIEAKNQTGKAFKSADKGMAGLRKKINAHSTAIKLAAAGAVAALGTFAFQSVSEASDLEESMNAVNVVFGEGADIIHKFGRSAATNVGLARSQFNQLSSQTGALLKDVGIPMEDVADKTNMLSVRAADMASVMNTDVEVALSAINQALRGETEAIRRFTGDVTDATIEQFRLANGMSKPVKEMNEQEKRLLRMQVVMEQTDKFAGDFANTNDSLANKQRILTGRFKDAKAEIGTELMPMFEGFVDLLAGPGLEGLGNFVEGIDAVKEIAGGLGNAFQGFLDRHPEIARVTNLMKEGFEELAEQAGKALQNSIEASRERRGQGRIQVDPETGKIVSGGVLQFATGGIVPGQGAQPAIVHGGEMVLNKSQQEKMFRMLEGNNQQQEAPQITINVQSMNQQDVPGIAEMLGARIQMNPRFN